MIILCIADCVWSVKSSFQTHIDNLFEDADVDGDALDDDDDVEVGEPSTEHALGASPPTRGTRTGKASLGSSSSLMNLKSIASPTDDLLMSSSLTKTFLLMLLCKGSDTDRPRTLLGVLSSGSSSGFSTLKGSSSTLPDSSYVCDTTNAKNKHNTEHTL